MGILTVPVGSEFLGAALARQLLEQHRDRLPDLSGLIVLVANHRAGQDFARALANAAGRPLLPPRITPLKTWAESVANGVGEPAAQRLARLHGVLRQQTWLGQVDKWALAQELLTLADELSAARLGGDIAGRIRALHADALDRETALIEAVWRTLNQHDNDPQARYARALHTLVQHADAPLYAYALGPLTAVEKRFFEDYAERAPVQFFIRAESSDGVAATLQTAWQTTEPPLKTRAEGLAAAHRTSPLVGHLKLCPAAHLEAEARAVATWVAGQLHAGRRRLALIALDRVTSRRARALLERMQVLVSDETGWTLSTTTAAAVIDRWLGCVANDFPHSELLDLLKSPFVLGEPAERQEPVLALEGVMRKFGIARGMRDVRRAAQADSAAARALRWLDEFDRAARGFSLSRASLHLWLTRLLASLEAIAALPALRADAAGAAVLDMLDQLRNELVDDRERYSFDEWRRWLDMALEQASFMDTGVSSPIVLTSLPAARGRVFEAVAMIGADAQHLPTRATPGLFSQSVRAQLGLATSAEDAAQTIDDMLQLLTQGPALISWQASQDNEPNPASPLVTRLQALHQAAWQCDIELQPIGEPPVQPSILPEVTQPPAPVLPLHRLPRRYSPTAYQMLLDCPYRFFARSVLGLRELDDVEEGLDKSDYGNALHRILKRFHDAAPSEDRDAALSLLDQLSEAEFAPLPAYTAADWRIKWRAIQPAYVDAWLAAVEAGWRVESSETEIETELDVPSLGKIVLHGRLDRIDRKGEALQVIDYKTTARKKLESQRNAPGENVQLAVYAYLCNAAAAFLPIHDATISPVMLDGETDVEAIVMRLPLLLEALVQQAGLNAHGIDGVCQYCEVRGLCRKGNWERV